MRLTTYLTISETESKTLDALIKDLGFTSRTEYFTAVAHVAIYGPFADNQNNPGQPATTWIKTLTGDRDTTLTQQETFMDILHEIAFPVIAARGGEHTLTLIAGDLKTAMLDRCGAIPTNAQMKEWTTIFENIFRPELTRYRTTQYRDKIAKTRECAP